MADNFSPQEILKIAIKVEENGKKLFGILEEKASAEKIKSVWRYLKEQEEVHRKVFQDMLDNAGDYIVYEFSPGEYEAYIKAIAASYIFTTRLVERKIKDGFASDQEAVDFGIHIEKESILTYTALREYVQTSKQVILDKVIKEEKGHLVKLTALKESL
jgi:rubrerythrin